MHFQSIYHKPLKVIINIHFTLIHQPHPFIILYQCLPNVGLQVHLLFLRFTVARPKRLNYALNQCWMNHQLNIRVWRSSDSKTLLHEPYILLDSKLDPSSSVVSQIGCNIFLQSKPKDLPHERRPISSYFVTWTSVHTSRIATWLSTNKIAQFHRFFGLWTPPLV